MSAPATQMSGLPLTPHRGLIDRSRSSRSNSADELARARCRVILLTDSFGRSSVMTAMPSSRVIAEGHADASCRSTTIAKPMPPAAQPSSSPNCPPRRRSSLSSVVVMRAPVAPNGCPIAIDPPITLSCARSTRRPAARTPRARPTPATRTLEVRQHLRRERLVHLDEVDVAKRQSGALQRDRRGEHRRLSSCSPGSSAAYAYDRMNPSGA